MNSELRHWFPQGTDFNKVSQKRLYWVFNDVINEKIRPYLNWISAKEIFLKNIK
ncbi:Spiroplasmavirus-related protein [Spiroplasma kunkelii CR2-3x]|uniref:Spiroplasmavirus-related protein n=1 Tax=Spiroplasma kunkelii CR2-3x TaxID=273035 RepID=A0A0K2JGS5_SPIKU|nr:Spiroplasmavirus-related protein [Spiroplasma kunkelii CR2-3x]